MNDNETKKEKSGFSIRLKKARKTLKYTQREFADSIGISIPSYSEMESGKYKPKYELLECLASKYKINLYYLLFGEGPITRDPNYSIDPAEEDFAVNLEDVRKFLWHFKRSHFVQLMMLGYFRTIMRKEKETINQEIEEYEEKPGV